MKTFKKISNKGMQVIRKKSRSWMAGCFAVVFSAQTVLAAAEPSVISQSAQQTTLIEQASSFLETLMIPAQAGRIERVFIPHRTTANATPILLIQDAHANPEAQKNIAVILDTLARHHQLAGVAVEGAFGPVDARLLDIFDNEETNRAFSDQLVEQGQLTGAEIFSRSAQDYQVPVRGADDQELYLQSFQAYQTVKRDAVSLKVLADYRKEAVGLEMTRLNPDLAAFLRERRNWLEKNHQAADYIRLTAKLAQEVLRLDLTKAQNQFDWPSLMRLVRSVELEDQLNAERVSSDIERLKKDWRGRPHASWIENSAEALQAALKDRNFKTWIEEQTVFPVKTIRRFFEEITAASSPAGISLLNYPDLLIFSAMLILQEEIITENLLEELSPLETKIEEKLIRTDEEREIVRFSKDLDLTEKLLTLKLTREDYFTILRRGEDFSAEVLRERRLKAAALGLAPLPRAELLNQETLTTALDFYRLSDIRDRVLVGQAMALAASLRTKSGPLKGTALIAGGFHQEGVVRELEQQGMAYAVITPRMMKVPKESLYDQVMTGQGLMMGGVLPSAAALMAEILGAPDYIADGAAPGRREGLLLDGLFNWRISQMVRQGFSTEEIHKDLLRALERAANNGLLGSPELIRQDPIQPGGRVQFQLTLPSQGVVFVYELGARGSRQVRAERLPEITTEIKAAALLSQRSPAPFFISPLHAVTAAMDRLTFPGVKAARSEVRAPARREDLQLDTDAYRWLQKLPRTHFYERALAAMELLERKKRAQTQPLTAFYAESLPSMGPPRSVTIIEVLLDDVAKQGRLSDLPIAYRAAVVLQAFDQEHFGSVHGRLVEMFEQVQLIDENSSDRLSAAAYRRLMSLSEREHLTSIDQYVLFQTAVNRFIIDLDPVESRALEKESIVQEMMKELDQPGTGKIRQMVFLTDLHGGKKVGDLIGFALGLENYRNIRSVQELEKRLAEENIHIDEKNILFVGGSDYVDRGPNPYRAFQFVRWLRSHGKLKFINGNHDDWKDWNLLGVHLRVHDALRRIVESGRLDERYLNEHVQAITPFITTTKKSDEEIQKIEAAKKGLVQRFLKNARDGKVGEDVIDVFANEIIDSGANPNHSLEWWSREWYEHAGWADTFLDEMNEMLINQVLLSLNAKIAANPLAQQKLRALLSSEADLQTLSGAERAAMLESLKWGRLFELIEASLFSEHEDVKKAKAEIEELKKKNLEIRTSNERLAAQGRYEEMVPQLRVPTMFPVTSRLAQEYLRKITDIAEELRRTLNEDSLSPDSAELVMPENYRKNPIVADTALWDLQNTRLIYVDNLGNAYLHGIIPIDASGASFNVRYRGLDGVAAIERMQYDIRRFFERYEVIPDSREFRDDLEREVGDAFRILNDWYSDLTAYLKPPQVIKFLEAGGPANYSYATASAYNPRMFDPSHGVMHVGHVDLAKMRENRLAYWINGLTGGIINGDHDLSEGYHGLGGMVIHFMPGEDGRKMGLRRFGYEETVSSIAKEIKDKENAAKKKKKELDELKPEEADFTKRQGKLSEIIAALNDDVSALKARLASKKQEVSAQGGETIKDITLHELPPEQRQNAAPFLDGGDYAYYYAQRFLYEIISDYEELEQWAKSNGLPSRVEYYRERRGLLKETLAYLHEHHQEAHPLHPARSELRLSQAPASVTVRQKLPGLDSFLEEQGRSAGTVFTTAVLAASSTVDIDLSRQYPSDVRRRLFGDVAVMAENPQAVLTPETEQALSAFVTSRQTVERPKTVVLVSLEGQVPQIDPELMDLLPGSRVVVMDRRGSKADGRRIFSKSKLSPEVRLEHEWFQGSYPSLDELKSIFDENTKTQLSSDEVPPGQAALPLLILPYVEESFLEQYAALQTEDGIVVRTPKMRGEKLRKGFSKFLGLRAAPSELRDILPDEFRVQVRERGFSSAYIPLAAEGRFAALMNAMTQIRAVEAAA